MRYSFLECIFLLIKKLFLSIKLLLCINFGANFKARLKYNTKQYLNHTIHYFVPWESAKTLIDTASDENYQLVKVFNDSIRSKVCLIRIDGQLLILKRPVEKNSRRWIRFTTLMRKSEALQSCISMLKIQEIGIETNKPLVVIEKHRMGMVVDSWYLYSYVDGDVCNKKDYPAVVHTLNKIHQSGYLHGDPQILNFLKGKTGIQVIDVKISKRWNFVQSQLELVYLKNSAIEIGQYISTSIFSYKIAEFITNNIQGGFRTFKYKLRQIIRP